MNFFFHSFRLFSFVGTLSWMWMWCRVPETRTHTYCLACLQSKLYNECGSKKTVIFIHFNPHCSKCRSTFYFYIVNHKKWHKLTWWKNVWEIGFSLYVVVFFLSFKMNAIERKRLPFQFNDSIIWKFEIKHFSRNINSGNFDQKIKNRRCNDDGFGLCR